MWSTETKAYSHLYSSGIRNGSHFLNLNLAEHARKDRTQTVPTFV